VQVLDGEDDRPPAAGAQDHLAESFDRAQPDGFRGQHGQSLHPFPEAEELEQIRR
jgi:hypothetical protein